MKLGDRPTADLVVIFLAGIVGFTVIVSIIGFVFVTIYAPDTNLTTAAARITGLVNTLAGAIVGYIAGRGARNGNGSSTRRDGTDAG